MVAIPPGFPDALLPALRGELGRAQAALVAAPSLAPLWQALGQHAHRMIGEGWAPTDAAGVLVGGVLTPIAMGYDAHGTLSRRVREGVSMERREKAAAMAADLARLLDEIEREPFPPDAVVAVGPLLHPRLVARDAPSALKLEPTAALLRLLADALNVAPVYGAQPGLASQKASWRGFIREVRDNLDEFGFVLRERDAVALATVLCAAAGMVVLPSRDAVRDALRWGDFTAEPAPK
jgi:hypothetical protein